MSVEDLPSIDTKLTCEVVDYYLPVGRVFDGFEVQSFQDRLVRVFQGDHRLAGDLSNGVAIVGNIAEGRIILDSVSAADWSIAVQYNQ